MIITVTSIRLRKLWYFFQLSYLGYTIMKQTRSQPGFLQMKNKGFGYLHYTLSAWDSQEAMEAFARTGAHREAMKSSAALATEIRTYTLEGVTLPSWKVAEELLIQKGKLISFPQAPM